MIKNKQTIINNLSTIILGFIFAASIGALGREALIKQELIKPTVVLEVKKDEMPLDNGNKVIIEMTGNDKNIIISYNDFVYLSKKNARIRKLIKDIDALYSRMK